VIRPLFRILIPAITVGLLAVSCGSDGDDSSDVDDTSTTTTSTTVADDAAGEDDDEPGSTTTAPTSTTPDETTTTTEAVTSGTGTTGVLAEGSLTTDAGLTAEWSLTATAMSLCFEATLAHPDPVVAAGAGAGVSDCLEPAGGLDQLDSGLSVDVGGVDGERTIGFLWGRVAPEVISLTIEHTDGSQTPIGILDGPTEVGVFADVTEVASIPPVQDLDAVSGTQIEGSVPIRDFLRAGPTYPVTTTPPTTAPPSYPVN
jgi:hypothetical protein